MVLAVIHGQNEAVDLGVDRGDRVTQISRESRDPAVTGKVIPQQGNSSDASLFGCELTFRQ
jgi:hypothetical protein